MSTPPLIAAAQINATSDIPTNLKLLDPLIAQASAKGAQLIVLPECSALMPQNPDQLRQLAEPHPPTKTTAPIQTHLAARAAQHKISIAACLALRSPDPKRPYNSLLIYDPHGNNTARYDKIHLFNAKIGNQNYRESAYTHPGAADPSNHITHPTPFGTLGLSICYDLRYPEHYRRLLKLGATILLIPSAFTVPTGKAHWRTLLRARAIENACYVIAPAQVGTHADNRQTYGHSLIIDPWGETLAECTTQTPHLLLAQINPQTQTNIRARFS